MEARSADAVLVCRICSMLKPRLWHANPTETRDARASCGGIGPCSNPRPNNQSVWVLWFGLIADRPMGSIRAIHSHHRKTSRRIAPSNQSNQSFLRLFGRTHSIASIGHGIVGGMHCCPINTIHHESRRSGWHSRGLPQASQRRPRLELCKCRESDRLCVSCRDGSVTARWNCAKPARHSITGGGSTLVGTHSSDHRHDCKTPKGTRRWPLYHRLLITAFVLTKLPLACRDRISKPATCSNPRSLKTD